MNQNPQVVRNTAILMVFSFVCASFLWFLISAASVGWLGDTWLWLLWALPILAWAGLAVFGLTQRRRSAQAAGIAVAAVILPFLCGGSWGLLLTLILTQD